jgi:mannose-6-phosphate isomerase
VLCEIQEYSDLTYRVYDYNRRDAHGMARPLHIEKALDVIEFGEQRGGKIEPVRIERGGLIETYFIACRYFTTEKWEFAGRITRNTSREQFELLIFLEGTGTIDWGGNRVNYSPAQVWMMPAALDAYELAPKARTSLLRTYVPSDGGEFTRRLADQGIAETEWSRLVHP